VAGVSTGKTTQTLSGIGIFFPSGSSGDIKKLQEERPVKTRSTIRTKNDTDFFII
jgi:hypothetical protein